MLVTPGLLNTEISVFKRDSVKHEMRDVYSSKKSKAFEFQTKVYWKNVLIFTFFHVAALYGLYLTVFLGTWKSMGWTLLLVVVGNVGVTAGAHRMWSHKAYKAKLPLKIILMLCHSMAFQKTIYEWARDHRCHHKYTHTHADPYNPERGAFFSHIGWLLMEKHPEVIIKGKGIDISDVEMDPVVQFQKRHYYKLVALTCFVFPATVPWYFWGENLWVCWYAPTFLRFAITLNSTLAVNSIAHFWGARPYDASMGPADNVFLMFLTSGDGWHNFHHVFPWDYKSGEFGDYALSPTTLLIDFFSILGWAYDLKTVSAEMVLKRKKRTGGGNSYTWIRHHPQDGLWGWGDGDMKKEDVEKVTVYNQLQK